VRTPVAGIVARRAVNVGDTVAPGQALAAVTQTDDVWVTANFRETQLRRMHPGQRATLHVDALARDFGGWIESTGGATGSRTSLFPPENATGNFVKVVQRIPVRIRFDADQEGLERLRPGMSVEPKVRVIE
jgi:membrane fusion protein (multidrug efflux system)